MKRARREARKESADSRKRSEAEKRENSLEIVAIQQNQIANAFRRSRERINHALHLGFPGLHKKAPKLLDRRFNPLFEELAKHTWVRPFEDWTPKGKSPDTLAISLLEHLLAKYPTPKFLWEVFFNKDLTNQIPVVLHVASGGSLYDKAQTGEFPVAFTRKMCHAFLKTPVDHGYISAIRRTQVKAFGGSEQLFRTWFNGPIGSRLLMRPDETFWATVLQFFANNPMLDLIQVNPLVDYITSERRRNPQFSMRGRTVQALTRDMEAWHAQQPRRQDRWSLVPVPSTFQPSGIPDGFYQTGSKKANIDWFVEEILTKEALAEEGRAMHHCVASYGWRIADKSTSIWSLYSTVRAQGDSKTVGSFRNLTIQVDNASRRICQYRGVCNRVATAEEFKILQRWAQDNKLTMGSSW